MKANYLFLLLSIPLLCACQSTHELLVQNKTSDISLYIDNEFQSSQPIHIESEQEIFQLDDDMLKMVSTKLSGNKTNQQKAYILLEHLFNAKHIALTYDGNANLTASQTYHAKIANCMSLTIMAYALANQAGMNITFREVDVPEYWVRNGQYNLLTGHVNLLVSDDDPNSDRVIWGGTETQIDFDPFVAKKKFPTRSISKATILAMFYNNKGADALAKSNYAEAYQYLKQATLTDKRLSIAWGNLGVLYKLSKHEEYAEYAYKRAISLQHNNLNALANLAMLLNKQGREQEALPIEAYLYDIRNINPYYHALLANEALYNNAYDQALKHYKKAISIDDVQHEFYFGLAKTYYLQGRLLMSKKAIKKAVSLTQTKYTQSLYTAKLNFLQLEATSAL